MRRPALILATLALIASACGDGTTGSTTTTTSAATTTTILAPTTSAVTSTAAPTPTAGPTTSVPGTHPVEDTAYCVRGTDPSDTLNVRAGPGTGYQVVGRLAWNADAIPAGGRAAPDGEGRLWLEVELEGGTGWAAGWYLVPAPCEAAVADPVPLAGPGMPDALSGGLVPWARVDHAWVLALYSPAWDGPRALYLLSPYGDTYEVFTWPTSAVQPIRLHDWRPDGRAALIEASLGFTGNREIRLLDLAARSSTTVLAVTELGYGGPAAFTRPTGRDVVYATGDATTEVIEVRYTDGSLFSTLLDQPRSADWRRAATWLYGLEGTTVVVADGSNLSLLSNQGDLIRALDAPGVACAPVRWWDTSTVLVRCIPPEVLAYQPDSFYRRLWLVPMDGSAGTPLTALPAGTVDIVDFGYSDAGRAGSRVFAQWMGDCGSAGVSLVAADGTTTGFAGQLLVGLRDENLIVRRWDACDLTPGSLHVVGPDGLTLDTLIRAPAEGPGVLDALMMRDLP